LNGTIEGDWEGEYTYGNIHVGARDSFVIDYVAINEGIRDRIRTFKIGEKDSDHLSLEIEIIEEGGRNLEQEQEKIEEEEEIEVVIWDKEAIQKYNKNGGTEQIRGSGSMRIKDNRRKWERIKKIVWSHSEKKDKKKKEKGNWT